MGEERGTQHGQPSDTVKGFLSIVHEEATIIRKETKLASFTQTKLKQKRGLGASNQVTLPPWTTQLGNRERPLVGVTEEAARKGGGWRQE